jgi:hypothetical protein
MKVIVCFSGALPMRDADDEQKINRNIQKIKSILPKADFVFTTWEDQPDAVFINKRYKVPVMSWCPGKAQIKHDIKMFRGLRDEDPDIIKEFNDWQEKNLNTAEELKTQIVYNIGKRQWYKQQQKQHIIHALTVRDFVDPKQHDIVIRMRYDSIIRDNIENWIERLCMLCHETRRPIGLHRYPRQKQQIYSSQPIMEFATPTKNIDSTLLRDFILIHRADMCDPNILEHLYESKTMSFSEPAWYQWLCKPYGVRGFIVNLGVTTNKIDEFEQFERAKPHGEKKHLTMLISTSYPGLS